MEVIVGENIVAFDVDDTLILYGRDESNTENWEDLIVIENPYDGSANRVKIHREHIKLLRQYKGRGLVVIVWSAAGYKWAETVVKALQIEDAVDYIMTKPSKLVDDLQPSEVFGTRIYLKDR